MSIYVRKGGEVEAIRFVSVPELEEFSGGTVHPVTPRKVRLDTGEHGQFELSFGDYLIRKPRPFFGFQVMAGDEFDATHYLRPTREEAVAADEKAVRLAERDERNEDDT